MSDAGATCAVVLAAGAGRRFGGAGKLVASLGGRPVVAWVVEAAAASSVDRVVVVVGSRAAAVRAAVPAGSAEIIECSDWSDGMSASLRCGLSAVREEWAAVLLGDGPGVTASVVDAVVSAARGAAADVDAVRPMRGGRPAHPVALRRSLLARVDELQGDAGFRELLRGAHVLELDASAWPDLGDVDTPEALDALRNRFDD